MLSGRQLWTSVQHLIRLGCLGPSLPLPIPSNFAHKQLGTGPVDLFTQTCLLIVNLSIVHSSKFPCAKLADRFI